RLGLAFRSDGAMPGHGRLTLTTGSRLSFRTDTTNADPRSRATQRSWGGAATGNLATKLGVARRGTLVSVADSVNKKTTIICFDVCCFEADPTSGAIDRSARHEPCGRPRFGGSEDNLSHKPTNVGKIAHPFRCATGSPTKRCRARARRLVLRRVSPFPGRQALCQAPADPAF